MPARADQRGFTLVEVLVALTVTSLMMVLIMNAATAARERRLIAGQRMEAVTLARSLGEEAFSNPLAEGHRAGEVGRLRWTVDERIEMRDARGFFALTAIVVNVLNDRKIRLFRGEIHVIKSVAAT